MTARSASCSPAERQVHLRAAALFAASGLLLAGCGVRPPLSGAEPGAHGRYATVAVVPLLADEVRLEASNGWSTQSAPRVAAGWQTRARSGRIFAELLEPAGTRVIVLDAPDMLAAGSADTERWSQRVWQQLRADNRLAGVDAVVVLRQNAIDPQGHEYAPAMNFLAFGLVGLAIGAAEREERFQPSFSLAVNEGFHAAMVGASRCSIGFNARLLDAASGRIIAQADGVLGQEQLPAGFSASAWERLRPEQRQVAETYCIAALRRGISQAVNELNLLAR